MEDLLGKIFSSIRELEKEEDDFLSWLQETKPEYYQKLMDEMSYVIDD